MSRIAFVNDHFIDEDKATLGIQDLALQRGFGIFDFFKVRGNIPLFIDDYIDRFFQSAAFMRMNIPANRKRLLILLFIW
jgi:branched-chain amino acid aminotransferase